MSWQLFWQIVIFTLLGMIWSLMLVSSIRGINGKREKL